MNCAAPLPGDDDGPFPPNDPLLPLPGHEPSDAAEECLGPDPLGGALRVAAAVVLLVLAATVVAAAVKQ